MIKVAINILPLKNAHKNRGIGYYTENLVKGLREDPDIDLQEFINVDEVKNTDVIHYPWFDFYFNTLPIKKTFPTIVTIHDVIPLKFKEHYPVGFKGKVNFFLQKRALKSCSAIVTDSEASKIDIVNYLKIEPKKVNVLYFAQDSDFKVLSTTSLIRTKRKYNLPDEFLLYVGDANWIKNLPFLIQGFKNIVSKPQFKNLKLILVGGVFLKNVENIDHPELVSLKMVNQLIKDNKLEENIIKVGNIEKSDLIALYNLATIYIQPSLYEGFGLPLLEAMACGAPVVSSNRGSLKEVGGNAAVYFNPDDKIMFESLIRDILENRSLQEKLSRLGCKRAEQFNLERVIQNIKLIYMNIKLAHLAVKK